MISVIHIFCKGSGERQSREIGIGSNGFGWVEWDKNLSGITGSGSFSGNMAEFQRILLFGEYLHAGKGAAYGLGRYHLEKSGPVA